MPSPMPLRRYLSLQLALVAILPVIIIALLVWQILLPQMRTSIHIQHQALARAVAGQVSAHLMGGARQLTALADYVDLKAKEPPGQLSELLDTQCGSGDLFETIYVISRHDDSISSIGLSDKSRARREDLQGLDFSGRAFMHAARDAQNPLWSETFLSTASSTLAVALTVAQRERIVVGEITLDRLSEFISHLPLGAGLITMVVDRNGRILADSQHIFKGQQLNIDRLVHHDSDDPPGDAGNGESFELEGVRMVGTVVGIEQLGWKVLVAQTLHKAYEPLRSAFLMIAVGLAAALFMAVTVAWLRAGHLSALFRLYAERARSIARGHYDLEWPVSRTEEFTMLAQSLQEMAQMISQRERQLVASESQMGITLDAIGDAVIATDDHGCITRMNPVAESMTGWSKSEAAGKPLPEVFHIINGHSREIVLNPAEKVLAKGGVVGLANHTVLVARDGREYQIADSGAPIRRQDGQIVGVVLVFRDVSEKYAREQQIRASEQLLQEITANVPGVVYQFKSTADHVYSMNYVSGKARQIFGLSADRQTFFERFRERIPAREIDRFMDSIREAVDKCQPWQYEGRFEKPDGEEIWFSGHAAPHREGDTLHFFGMLMDITQRKQLEENLRLTLFCFEKASIAILRIGRDGGILNANEQACRSLGYTREEICGLSVFDIDPNFNIQDWPRHLERTRGINTHTFETEHRRKNGTLLPVEVLSNIVEFEDQEYRISYVKDISERKRAEKQTKRLEQALAQSQKMEAIGTLAGGIAHDFNNILSAIIGFAELSLPLTDADSLVNSNLRKMITAGLRARDLVQQILTFSRKADRELRPLQVGPVVKESLKLLRSSLPATIAISHQIEEGVDHVMADATQIHQIVMNLCTNAAHAMEAEGGQIKVSLSQITLSEKDGRSHPGLLPGTYLKLSVQDTGKGIPHEIMDKIFDPYFTTKAKGKGTGLGLAVVHGIVESYGGAVYAYSEPHQGATFNVYIPTIGDLATEEQNGTSDLQRGSEHVLLVDDEPTLIDVGRQMLEILGYRVSTASNSAEALELFTQEPKSFDLVLTDMTMPGMTGLRLAGELLKIRPELPIIISTGYSEGLNGVKPSGQGIRAFVHKPLVLGELARIVRESLDHSF